MTHPFEPLPIWLGWSEIVKSCKKYNCHLKDLQTRRHAHLSSELTTLNCRLNPILNGLWWGSATLIPIWDCQKLQEIQFDQQKKLAQIFLFNVLAQNPGLDTEHWDPIDVNTLLKISPYCTETQTKTWTWTRVPWGEGWHKRTFANLTL